MVARLWKSLLLTALIVGAVFVATAPSTLSWSDGTAGGTAQVPERLRECAEGFRYCKVTPSLCGGCHGQASDMRHQEESEFPVTDRIGANVVVSSNPDLWEYTPGRPYFVEVSIKFKNGFNDLERRDDARPAGYGEYASGAFALNASAGTLSREPAGDPAVRITGGDFQHYGSRNDTLTYECPDDPTKTCRYGAVKDNERQHAGEAVNTWDGAHQRSWTMKWTPPAQSTSPFGVAFQASVMVPDGNGWDSCVHVQCNSSLGYSDQSQWDWWTNLIEDTRSPSVPRAVILCEEGVYDTRKDCSEAVLAAVLPPTPPPDTSGGTDGTDGENGGISPVLTMEAGVALVAAAAAVGLLQRRRR
jgi:hypothetical protein